MCFPGINEFYLCIVRYSANTGLSVLLPLTKVPQRGEERAISTISIHPFRPASQILTTSDILFRSRDAIDLFFSSTYSSPYGTAS